ncbi:MAG TPA: IS110 family transposase [Vicinamibacterales bacterium]|nr:IS110 family transposase [Vicinamibacterales bacterium]
MEQEYIGVDLHKAFFQVCAIARTGERQWEQRWPTTDEGIAGLLTRCGPQSRIAVEASSPTWAFVDRIVTHVGAVHVVDARKTRLKAGYAAKTDRLDAQRLADALRRDSVVGIYYPPPPIRDLRELCRYRCHLARLQASVKQRIHALLLRHGVVVPVRSLFSQRGAAWLARLTLPGWGGASLRGLRQILVDVRGQLVPVVSAIRATAATDVIARALDTRPGFGPVFSVTLRAEIGTITRFPDGPHLASYAGLVPRVERSGGRQWSGRITKAGSPWMRWTLIEAAIHQFRRQDDFGRWARQLAVRKGMLKARVAVARALCDALFDTWPRA